MVTCPKCQNTVAAAKFCPECGARLGDEPVASPAAQVAASAPNPALSPSPKTRKRPVWPWIAGGLILVIIALVAFGTGGSSITVDSSKPLITNKDFDQVLSNPNAFRRHPVEVVGRVFIPPKQDGDTVQFQIYTNPVDSEGNTLIKFKGAADSIKRDSLVKIKGVIAGELSGENMFGAKITAPIVLASSVESATYTDIDPALRTFKGAKINQNGISLTIEKVDLSKRQTRVFLTLENNSRTKFSLFGHSSTLTAGQTQLKEELFAGGYFPELETDLAAGAKSSGVLIFAPAPASATQLRFTVEGTNFDFNFSFRPFQFDLSEGGSAAAPTQTNQMSKVEPAPSPGSAKPTGTAQSSAPPLGGGVKADSYYVEGVVSSYVNVFADAINNNQFSLISPFLVPNSPIYNSQKATVAELAGKGIKEKLEDFNIEEMNGGSGVWDVKVRETYTVRYSDGTSKRMSFNWIYTVKLANGQFGISEMRQA